MANLINRKIRNYYKDVLNISLEDTKDMTTQELITRMTDKQYSEYIQNGYKYY